MKAAIYNPYLDSLGGGERYTMAVATSLVHAGYSVDLAWNDESIKSKLEKRFGIKLDGVQVVDSIQRGDGYDVCFWVSDGSIPLLKSRNNILHFQVPFKDIEGKTLMNKMKFFRIKHIVCNSYFTKSFIDESYGVDSEVVYPPVDVEQIKAKRKENIILYVGRFSQLTQSKRQDVLIDAFKKFYDKGNKKWKFVLAGGTEVGVDEYMERLQESAQGYPISFSKSPSFPELQSLFGKAKLFWSASGFGVDEMKTPHKVEHFGISLVEALAAGCIPFAYEAGGHKEILAEGENGFLWKSIDELVEKTIHVTDDVSLVKKISKHAIQSSRVYEYNRFEAEIVNLIDY